MNECLNVLLKMHVLRNQQQLKIERFSEKILFIYNLINSKLLKIETDCRNLRGFEFKTVYLNLAEEYANYGMVGFHSHASGLLSFSFFFFLLFSKESP